MRKRKFISPFEVGIPSEKQALEALVELTAEENVLGKRGVSGSNKLYAVFARRYAYWHTLEELDLTLSGFRYHHDYPFKLDFLGLLGVNPDNEIVLRYLDKGLDIERTRVKEEEFLKTDGFKTLFFQRFEVDRIRQYLGKHINDMVKAFKTKSFLFAYEAFHKDYTPKLVVRTGLGPNDVMELTPIYYDRCEKDEYVLGIKLYPNTDDYKKIVKQYHFIIPDINEDMVLEYNFVNLMYTGNPYVLIDLEAALKKPDLRKKYMYDIGLALLYNFVANFENYREKIGGGYNRVVDAYNFYYRGCYPKALVTLIRQIMKWHKAYFNDLHKKHVDLFEERIERACKEYYWAKENVSAIKAIEPFVVLPGPIEFETIS